MPLTLDRPQKLHDSLIKHECKGGKPALRIYVDTAGKITCGVGHNLTDNGISYAVAEHLLSEDIMNAMNWTAEHLPWVQALDDVRKRAFVELAFNLGDALLGFHNALSAAISGDWATCVAGFKSSLWARQVGPGRAGDIEQMLATGTDPV